MKLTDVQQEQLARAQSILGEHFDHYSIFVGTDRRGDNGQNLIDCTSKFRGPKSFLTAAANTIIEVLKRHGP